MSANTTVWVEVNTFTTEWRKTYGVVPDDGIENIDLEDGESTTGRALYYNPDEELTNEN